MKNREPAIPKKVRSRGRGIPVSRPSVPNMPMKPAASFKAPGWAVTCWTMSLPRFDSEAARETTMPIAVDIRKAGRVVIRPLPIDRIA